MTAQIRGPGIFLAQFVRDGPPYDTLSSLADWVAGLGYRGVQIPTWDRRVFDLDLAASSQAYCDDVQAALADRDLAATELAAPLQGQVLAMHPAYAEGFAPFHPAGLAGAERQAWAADQLRKAIFASMRFGTKTIPTLSGGFAWPFLYPWPPHPPGLVDDAFAELARRWRPLLDEADASGVSFAFEPHPGSDVFDGATYERFLEVADDHSAACLNYDPSHLLLQQLDYIEFLRLYGSRVRAFHVKDAEFRPSGRAGVYGGYRPWIARPGRFRSLGDGQVDFTQIFTLLTEMGYSGWAVLEWECCIKSPEQGAVEGAPFIARHLIERGTVAFDEFTAGKPLHPRRMLGLDCGGAP